ncbi:MAG: hypothetical protein KAJ40_06030 [Alphaproteobacteria bacterium]|nr:hypothetical protein [Alphaproteobacteria bacterium]
MDIQHYNQEPKRKAKFFSPPNILKAKTGSGGLNDTILDRAQDLLENHTADFIPLAELYINQMEKGIKEAFDIKESTDSEKALSKILMPCVQLKANGTMFHYPLVTRIADRFVQFMEVVERLDNETLDIANAFLTALKIVITGKIRTDGAGHGNALVEELNRACMRYFDKHKADIDENEED